MITRECLPQLLALMLITLLVVGCSAAPIEPTATSPPTATPSPVGSWSTGSEEFGHVDFVVTEDDTITKIAPVFDMEWSCGDYTAENIGGYAQKAWPIDDGTFEAEVFLLPSDFSSGPPFVLVFTGSFQSTSKASGTWEFQVDSETECKGTWSAEKG